ncbi:MAG: tungsten ABC transporter substrate-binding protein [Latescibacteria bacterium DG_63]|nr:MAG: tungsten ABC transporter substrate-binding protein [Latescibacteria bacterium DG_63]
MASPSDQEAPKATIRLATTTSTDNTGLLELLLPPFTKQHGIGVEVIAVGTGKALKLGELGDVDLVLVHDRASEEKFLASGFGVNPRDVMHNDFVIVGPSADPAGIGGMKDAAGAVKKIAQSKSLFVSRGDESGTHSKEKQLWKAAGVNAEGKWYLSAGQAMGAVLMIATEKQAYTLTDRGTYLAFKEKVDLHVLVQGDPRLYNPYRIIAVNPAEHPHVKYVEAITFIAYITSLEGQKIIAGFRIDGEQLFYPDAVTQSDLGR